MKDIKVQSISVQPILSESIKELGIVELFEKYIEAGKEEISTGQVLSVLLRNILVSPSPLYKVSEWLKDYSDGQGEFGIESNRYDDNRLARALDKLYESDRHSLMTELSGKAIEVHSLNTERIHNDTTSVSFTGDCYEDQPLANVSLKRGYNKDGKPACVQIVFGLNVCSDGHVPILMQLYDGNKTDDTTHKVNWDSLKSFLKKEDFIYIADSKLSTTENLGHIDTNNGRFISIYPKTKKEVQEMPKSLLSDEEEVRGIENWLLAYEVESSRKKGKMIRYKYYEGEKTKEGYRLIWIHSSAKAYIEMKSRKDRIEKKSMELSDLQPRLNQYYLKTKEQIEKRIDEILKKDKTYFTIEVIEHQEVIQKKVGRGRKAANSEYKEEIEKHYELKWEIDRQAVEDAKKKDGIFPLVTNTKLAAKEVLKNYKDQPFLEKRFNNLKSVLEVAPVFLEKPRRIEAMLFLYFIALMAIALIERKIHNSMSEQEVESLPILPQGKKTRKPTWNNIRYFFRTIISISVLVGIDIDQQLIKGLTPEHKKVLKLLDVPIELYTKPDLNWWIPHLARAG